MSSKARQQARACRTGAVRTSTPAVPGHTPRIRGDNHLLSVHQVVQVRQAFTGRHAQQVGLRADRAREQLAEDIDRCRDLRRCRKLYRALLVPGVLTLAPGETRTIAVPIGRRAHRQLGWIWCAADGSEPGDRSARSSLTLLEHRAAADLVQVLIASGRPHQIRIHCAAVGAPLLGDPLYGPDGLARAEALPGDGGYRLQAWRLELERPAGGRLVLEVPDALGF